MSKTYEFLKECGAFWVTTANENTPACRPFGAVMEYGNELYITTSPHKAVYGQLKKNPAVEITALRPGTRDWLRVSGEAEEVTETAIKARMLRVCPQLSKHYASPRDAGFAVFRIRTSSRLLCTDAGKTPLD